MYRVKIKISKAGYKDIFLEGVFLESKKSNSLSKKRALILELVKKEISSTHPHLSDFNFELCEIKKISFDFSLREEFAKKNKNESTECQSS